MLRTLLARLVCCGAMALVAPSAAHSQTPRGDGPAAIANTVFVGEDGRPIRLGDYRGKVVIVDFWGKWCGPCMSEMPSLKALQASLRDLGDRIVYVFVSIKPDHFADDTAWLKQSGMIGNNYRWADRTPAQYQAFFNISTANWWVPNSNVIDGNGNVAKWVRGNGSDWRVSIDFVRQLALASAAPR